MDFWEVLKVVARRWALTVPLVLLTAAVAVILPPRIDPAYSAAASTVVITPADYQNPANPFLALGPVTVASGLAASGDSEAAREQAADAGLADTFTVDQQGSRSPILSVQVEAATPELAVETVDYVREMLADQLTGQQEAIGAPAHTQYYLQDLTGAVSPVAVYDGAQRVRFLAVGIGLLLTVALAMFAEGIAVLRARRTRMAHGVDADSEALAAHVRERQSLLAERERLLDAKEKELDRRLGLLSPSVEAAGMRVREDTRDVKAQAISDPASAGEEATQAPPLAASSGTRLR